MFFIFRMTCVFLTMQDNGLVPIVEPEILLDGDHSIERTLEVAEKVWAEVFFYLAQNNVLFEGILLKPSMVTPGAEHKEKASPETIAKYTLTMLKRRVPPAVPGIMVRLSNFLLYFGKKRQIAKYLPSIQNSSPLNEKIQSPITNVYILFLILAGYTDSKLKNISWRALYDDTSFRVYIFSPFWPENLFNLNGLHFFFHKGLRNSPKHADCSC